MNKIGKRILAAAVASSVLVTPVFADPSVDDLKKSKESAQNEVSSLQTQLNTVVGKITELESQLSSKGEEIIQAQSDLEDAEAEEQKQYADMKVRIKYMYEAGDQSAVESLVGSENFSDMVNKAEYVSNLQEYVETKQKISDLKDQLEEEQSQLESMQTEYESQESKLDNLIASKQAEVSDLDQQIEEAERKAAEEELKRQQEEAARQAAAAEAARQQAASNRNNSSSSSSNSSSNSNKGNSSNKGTSNNAPSYVSGDAVSRAKSALGKPYVWGATGPNSFDCSGLVGFCLTGRYSRSCTSASLNALPTVSNPQPGDVCVRSGHCGIYIGNGQMIHAPHTGDVVKVASVPSNMRIVRP